MECLAPFFGRETIFKFQWGFKVHSLAFLHPHIDWEIVFQRIISGHYVESARASIHHYRYDRAGAVTFFSSWRNFLQPQADSRSKPSRRSRTHRTAVWRSSRIKSARIWILCRDIDSTNISASPFHYGECDALGLPMARQTTQDQIYASMLCPMCRLLGDRIRTGARPKPPREVPIIMMARAMPVVWSAWIKANTINLRNWITFW